MKKTLLSVLVMALFASIAGCSTTPTAIQHPIPTPTATIAPLTTSATALSKNGLSLTISLNSTSNSTTYEPGEEITINIDEKNILPRDNNITAAYEWPVQGLGVSSCNVYNYPFGIAVLQGYYNATSIASANPLMIFPTTGCPAEPVAYSYDFQPSSDLADIYTSFDSEPSPISMNTNVTLTGVWDRWVPVNSSEGSGYVYTPNGSYPVIGYVQATSNFSPGIYTLVGGDEWGTLVILYFSVS